MIQHNINETEESLAVKVPHVDDTVELFSFWLMQKSSIVFVYLRQIVQIVALNADDTAVMSSGNTWQKYFRNIDQVMCLISNWLNHNITLNISKTKLLCFHKTQTVRHRVLEPILVHVTRVPTSKHLYGIWAWLYTRDWTLRFISQ